MEKIPQDQFFKELIQKVSKQKESVKKQFFEMSPRQLLWRPDEVSWTIYNCFGHLNLSFKYYLPKIEKAINLGLIEKHKHVDFYAASFWGKRAINRMKPTDGVEIIKKYKAPEPLVPPENCEVNKGPLYEIERFLVGEDVFVEQIMKAPLVDFNRIKIKILFKSYNLSIADLCQFLAVHNERHILQAKIIRNSKKFPSK